MSTAERRQPWRARAGPVLAVAGTAAAAVLAVAVDVFLVPGEPLAWVYGLPVLIAATGLRVRWVAAIGVGAVGSQVLMAFVKPMGRAGADWLLLTLGAVVLSTVAVALAALRARLEQEVTQREAAVQVRDRFLSIAAHELRSPLTSLMGSAEYLIRSAPGGAAEGASGSPPPSDAIGGPISPEKQARALRRIDEQAKKLNRLITNLLDVSRLYTGKLVLDRVPVDLTALVAAAVAETQERAPDHDLRLHATDRLVAAADPLRLEQVLVNLLDNAVKFSPAGSTITVTLDQPSANTVRLQVADQGVGIPPTQLPHIFEQAYQAHGEGYRAGLGLGLYVCREIVERHGGTIAARCPAGGGTVLTVQLPADPAHPPAGPETDQEPDLGDPDAGEVVIPARLA